LDQLTLMAPASLPLRLATWFGFMSYGVTPQLRAPLQNAAAPACFLSGISGWFSLSLGAWVPNKLARRRMVSAARCGSTGSGRLD
jgi:hypothetical protein